MSSDINFGAGDCGHLGPWGKILLEIPSHFRTRRNTHGGEHLPMSVQICPAWLCHLPGCFYTWSTDLWNVKRWQCPAKPKHFSLRPDCLHVKTTRLLSWCFFLRLPEPNLAFLLFFSLFLPPVLCVFIIKINNCMKCRKEVMGKGLVWGVFPHEVSISSYRAYIKVFWGG